MRIALLLAGTVYATVLCCAALVGGVAPTGAKTPTPAAIPTPPDRAVMIGMSLGVHQIDRIERWLSAVDQIAAIGFDTVQIVTPMYQRNGASTAIRIDPLRCPTPKQLTAIIERARARGLRVALMPILLMTHPRGNEWRGLIHPQQWEPWWADYTSRMTEFADLAERTGVDLLCVGSELLSAERQTERWVALIQRVRARFGGSLTYSANWDHYHVPRFAENLDMMGVNGYWSAGTSAAGDAELAEGWMAIRGDLSAWSRRNGKPILLTEVGFPSLPWAIEQPWRYVADGHAANHEQQARGYRAFTAAWGDVLRGEPTADDSRATFAGVVFYEWDPFHRGGPNDTGYGLIGKPALDVLQEAIGRRR